MNSILNVINANNVICCVAQKVTERKDKRIFTSSKIGEALSPTLQTTGRGDGHSLVTAGGGRGAIKPATRALIEPYCYSFLLWTEHRHVMACWVFLVCSRCEDTLGNPSTSVLSSP